MADPHYMAWGRDDPFRRIETAAEALARRVVWEQGNRIGLLRVHATVGLVAGSQILLFGGPSQIVDLFGPSSRLILGLLAVVGGIILFWGLVDRPRSILKEFLGLCVLGLWDLMMTAGLAWARAHTSTLGLSWPWEQQPSSQTGFIPAYPVAVYGGMFALIVIHLVTLRTFRKNHAPPAPPKSVLREDEQ